VGQHFNKLLDRLSEYLAVRKGLLLILGVVLIAVNLVLQFTPGVGWLASTNLFLHLGVIIALVGVMLAWAL
jgi:hypothetical protein